MDGESLIGGDPPSVDVVVDRNADALHLDAGAAPAAGLDAHVGSVWERAGESIRVLIIFTCGIAQLWKTVEPNLEP
jgi:hypothetical protein